MKRRTKFDAYCYFDLRAAPILKELKMNLLVVIINFTNCFENHAGAHCPAQSVTFVYQPTSHYFLKNQKKKTQFQAS